MPPSPLRRRLVELNLKRGVARTKVLLWNWISLWQRDHTEATQGRSFFAGVRGFVLRLPAPFAIIVSSGEETGRLGQHIIRPNK
jgi:hypothetical protein